MKLTGSDGAPFYCTHFRLVVSRRNDHPDVPLSAVFLNPSADWAKSRGHVFHLAMQKSQSVGAAQFCVHSVQPDWMSPTELYSSLNVDAPLSCPCFAVLASNDHLQN